MEKLYIYLLIGFGCGFLAAWMIRTFTIYNLKKSNKSLTGYLESEKLKKEVFSKENQSLHQKNKFSSEVYELKIAQLKAINKRMDEDILLLQKSNEETEALLEQGFPVVHSLKLQLIEANNTIARYKAQLERIMHPDKV